MIPSALNYTSRNALSGDVNAMTFSSKEAEAKPRHHRKGKIETEGQGVVADDAISESTPETDYTANPAFGSVIEAINSESFKGDYYNLIFCR